MTFIFTNGFSLKMKQWDWNTKHM